MYSDDPYMYVEVEGVRKPIYKVCKGDEIDGHQFMRPLLYHVCTDTADIDEGKGYDIRELDAKLKGIPVSYCGNPDILDRKQQIIRDAAAAGLLTFPSGNKEDN